MSGPLIEARTAYDRRDRPTARRCHVDVEALAVEFEVAAAQNATIKTHIARLQQRITALHAEQYPDDVLLSVPGVGTVIASVIRGCVGNLQRFTNLAAFWARAQRHRPASSPEFHAASRVNVLPVCWEVGWGLRHGPRRLDGRNLPERCGGPCPQPCVGSGHCLPASGRITRRSDNARVFHPAAAVLAEAVTCSSSAPSRHCQQGTSSVCSARLRPVLESQRELPDPDS